MTLRKGLQAFVLVIVITTLAMPLRAKTVNNHDMTILFRNVVFFTDDGPGWTGKPLFRWQRPVVGIMKGGAQYRQHVHKLFAEFSKLTRLSFRLTDDQKKANLKIYFLSKAEIRKRFNAPKLNCLGRFGGTDTKGYITHAEVYISTDTRAKANHCLAEELVQILGLTGDINMFEESIFHDKSTQTSLTTIDEIMLQTLYHPDLKNGMTLPQAMPIARKVILEIMTNLSKP